MMNEETAAAYVSAAFHVQALEARYGTTPLLVEHLRSLAGHWERMAEQRPGLHDECRARVALMRAAIRRVEASYLLLPSACATITTR